MHGKTYLSRSHNPLLEGQPSAFVVTICDIWASIGTGFIYPPVELCQPCLVYLPNIASLKSTLTLILDSPGRCGKRAVLVFIFKCLAILVITYLPPCSCPRISYETENHVYETNVQVATGVQDVNGPGFNSRSTVDTVGNTQTT